MTDPPLFHRPDAMVSKIYAPAPSSSSAVKYNEQKVAEGKASVIFSSRIDDPKHPMKTFTVYENGSIRTEKMSFHASVNPGANDKMSETQVKDFIKDWMERMGYGKQPYIVYKHTDTGRVHYHIVSVRVDENGRKIPDFRERKRSQEAMKELMSKYDFAIGRDKKTETHKSKSGEKETNPYAGFDPKAGDYAAQIEKIADLAMSYYFKEPQQFNVIMESLGVKVIHREDGTMAFIGLDPKTHKPCTQPIEAKGIRYPNAEALEKHAVACKGLVKTREKQHLINAAKAVLHPEKGAKTELHAMRYMAKSGIYMKFSKTAEGKIFGVTFVDHHGKCCFKASDLNGVTASMFEAARIGKWAEIEKSTQADKDSTDKSEQSTQERIAAEAADLALSALGSERSRRGEDEEIMLKGRKV